MQVTVGNDPKDCAVVYWADADFAGSLRDSESTSGGYLMLVGPQTFVLVAWLCKKQRAVSNSTTEAKTISLDAGLRLEALPLLMLWDILMIDVFTTANERDKVRIRNVGGKVSGTGPLANQCREAIVSNAIYTWPNDVLLFSLENIHWVSPSMPKAPGLARLIICEDAVSKILVKGRSPTFRDVLRTILLRLNMSPRNYRLGIC